MARGIVYIQQKKNCVNLLPLPLWTVTVEVLGESLPSTSVCCCLAVCKSLRLTLVCERLRLTLVCESLRLSLVCESLRLALVCESLRLALVCEP